ncbi:hypothetical protein F4781DRAFT_386016 [Annulohypoxylon bovei var. microspora]|nr:hypothetical protein F4781DRAFT_386016 [Annulohypoxylon bovei var. microspora]
MPLVFLVVGRAGILPTYAYQSVVLDIEMVEGRRCARDGYELHLNYEIANRDFLVVNQPSLLMLLIAVAHRICSYQNLTTFHMRTSNVCLMSVMHFTHSMSTRYVIVDDRHNHPYLTY